MAQCAVPPGTIDVAVGCVAAPRPRTLAVGPIRLPESRSQTVLLEDTNYQTETFQSRNVAAVTAANATATNATTVGDAADAAPLRDGSGVVDTGFDADGATLDVGVAAELADAREAPAQALPVHGSRHTLGALTKPPCASHAAANDGWSTLPDGCHDVQLPGSAQMGMPLADVAVRKPPADTHDALNVVAGVQPVRGLPHAPTSVACATHSEMVPYTGPR